MSRRMYRGTPGPKFTKFSVDWPDPNAAKFRCAATRSVRDIRCRIFALPEKVDESSRKSKDQNPLGAATHRCI